MVESIISYSIRNKFLILFSVIVLTFASLWAVKNTSLDAIPDLSPPQVIVQVKWAGQSPKTIEEQISSGEFSKEVKQEEAPKRRFARSGDFEVIKGRTFEVVNCQFVNGRYLLSLNSTDEIKVEVYSEQAMQLGEKCAIKWK